MQIDELASSFSFPLPRLSRMASSFTWSTHFTLGPLTPLLRLIEGYVHEVSS